MPAALWHGMGSRGDIPDVIEELSTAIEEVLSTPQSQRPEPKTFGGADPEPPSLENNQPSASEKPKVADRPGLGWCPTLTERLAA